MRHSVLPWQGGKGKPLAGCALQEEGGQKEDGGGGSEKCQEFFLVKETDEIRGWAGHAFKGFIKMCVLCVRVSLHACV